ncbi:MAG: hypothetical protein PHF84_10670 [bacterium]|nr:hypothetical protein [bacterium]
MIKKSLKFISVLVIFISLILLKSNIISSPNEGRLTIQNFISLNKKIEEGIGLAIQRPFTNSIRILMEARTQNRNILQGLTAYDIQPLDLQVLFQSVSIQTNTKGLIRNIRQAITRGIKFFVADEIKKSEIEMIYVLKILDMVIYEISVNKTIIESGVRDERKETEYVRGTVPSVLRDAKVQSALEKGSSGTAGKQDQSGDMKTRKEQTIQSASGKTGSKAGQGETGTETGTTQVQAEKNPVISPAGIQKKEQGLSEEVPVRSGSGKNKREEGQVKGQDRSKTADRTKQGVQTTWLKGKKAGSADTFEERTNQAIQPVRNSIKKEDDIGSSGKDPGTSSAKKSKSTILLSGPKGSTERKRDVNSVPGVDSQDKTKDLVYDSLNKSGRETVIQVKKNFSYLYLMPLIILIFFFFFARLKPKR